MARTALVTGGTRGIGKAISIQLAQAGFQVGAVFRHDRAGAEIFAHDNAIAVFQWDVADFSACEAGVKEVERRLGPVEILINNAGVTADTTMHKMSLDQWRTVMYTNLDSLFNLSRQVINGMRDRQYGRIINISSINGEKGQFGQTNYAAAKAGILGFTKALALESISKNITVNAVAPGYCDTDMVSGVPKEVLEKIISEIPAKRLGTPAEIARLVAFLASEEAGFITGATFDINGGQYMR